MGTEVIEQKEFPRVIEVRAYVRAERDRGYNGANKRHWINGHPTPMASPMSCYPQYRKSWDTWGITAVGTVVVEVECEDGTVGVGVSMGNGGHPACYIIENHLSRFVEGQDPRCVELIWEQMYRGTLHYGRKGITIQAISAIDIALWDVLGKLRGEPVYQLLGGKTKDRLPLYCTTSKPELAKEMGFAGAKIICPYGPSDGDKGLQKNVQFFKEARQNVGNDYPLMLDCYMSLNVPYTIKLAHALEPFNLKLIEDSLHPEDRKGYAEVRKALRGVTLVATGEHEFTRYGFKELLEGGCADIIQPEVTWMGGMTEARKVVALAAAYNTPVIAHGSAMYSYHLQYAFTNCPVAEYMIMSPDADKIVPFYGDLFYDEPLPDNGYIYLPNKPGFGVTLNKTGLERPYPRSPEDVKQQYDANVSSKLCISSDSHIPF